MGKLLDILKKLFGGNDDKALMNINSEIDVSTENTLTSGTGQTGKIKSRGPVYIDNSKTFVINLAPGEPIPDDAKKFLRQQFEAGNVQFLAQESNRDIEDYNKFEKGSGETELLEFFRDKISQEDFQCLRTGLYVGQLSRTNKKRAVEIKDRAASRGRRNRNIINLASAGYFKTYIKPVFENNALEIAKEEYEEIVQYMPEIIFVNGTMTGRDVLKGIEQKIEQKEKYHLRVTKVIINGLGDCADVIVNVYADVTEKYPEYKVELETRNSDMLKRAKMVIRLEENA